MRRGGVVAAVYCAGVAFLLSTVIILLSLRLGSFSTLTRTTSLPVPALNDDTIVLSVGRDDAASLFAIISASNIPDFVLPPDPYIFPNKIISRSSFGPLTKLELAELKDRLVDLRDNARLPFSNGEKKLIVALSLRQIVESGLPLIDYLEAAWAAGFRRLVVLHRSYLRVVLEEAKLVESISTPLNAVQPGDPCAPIELRFPTERNEAFDHIDKMLRDAFVSTPFDNPLELSYEMHVRNDPSVAARMVVLWLGVQGLVIDSDLLGMPFPSEFDRCKLIDMIANKPDLHRFLDGTKWEWMLETDPEDPKWTPMQMVGAL